MTQRMNSKDLMDQIDRTVKSVAMIRDDLADLQQQTETKIAILNTYEQVANSVLASIRSEIVEKDRTESMVIFGLDIDNPDKVKGGSYSFYGQTIHPKLAKLPEHVFNFITGINRPLYKDNGSVSFIVDDTEDYKYEYCNILKEDADPTKKDVFKAFDANRSAFTLAVEVLPSKLVGNSRCNMIEIDPYLPGTFDITQIRIWTMQQYLSQDLDTAAHVIDTEYKNVGAQRIILDDTYQIYRIEFDIRLHMPTETGNYFGLRHLYLYRADMDMENSYVILAFHKDDYIRSPGNSITVRTGGRIFTGTPKMYRGAANYPCPEYYMIYENNTLQAPLDPDNEIARNITEFYVKFPLFEPVRSVIINDIVTR